VNGIELSKDKIRFGSVAYLLFIVGVRPPFRVPFLRGPTIFYKIFAHPATVGFLLVMVKPMQIDVLTRSQPASIFSYREWHLLW